MLAPGEYERLAVGETASVPWLAYQSEEGEIYRGGSTATSIASGSNLVAASNGRVTYVCFEQGERAVYQRREFGGDMTTSVVPTGGTPTAVAVDADGFAHLVTDGGRDGAPDAYFASTGTGWSWRMETADASSLSDAIAVDSASDVHIAQGLNDLRYFGPACN